MYVNVIRRLDANSGSGGVNSYASSSEGRGF
jgi:hypothetical protein